uniref:Uncharacterized protein LOC104210915 n=1 Tax=Nicotiana sylvestris TaxID=4096 RepID=A0A1U7V8P9_NICSY|nr:PREDICTED: uncharacterized protein LOC104210915 [Nicotiana sylvestris]XP_009758179.1 PREDICTED: uncharacterized protein LOC104210915 [Nicotiana sylvestris]XP_009758180.1 PREDICTED: uncharacterized protein LOC104210915 [Nicotiana sylvestris]XP_009758181.1 PREDICTED: uncharacterized protein LOC104210915 [Nicotiana sylvestris]XP_009758182.1 PREDICTED: uncharacterized protein LOC104210915 [Nicotiana sylvestris]XP_009758183.1 PREDICTED: uncharacterized protein LOC104210915 [Nicotiana sylvestris]
MPRAKRYQNLQKSVQPASTSQGVAQPLSTTESTPSHLDNTPQLVSFFQPTPSVQAAAHQTASVRTTSQSAPSVRAAAQPSHSVHATSQTSIRAAAQPTYSVQATSQLDLSVQAPSRPTQSKKRPRRECSQHWTVDAIDSQGATKKLKVKVKDVMYLSDEKCIVVEFDDMDQPIGERQGVLAGFCGILATDCSLFPIHFNKWPDLPKSYFNCCFDRIIKEKIELVVSQSATDESEVSPNDVVGKVLGKEHSGRVRCLGLGAIPSKVFRQTRRHFGGINSSSCDNGSCSSKREEKYNQIVNAHNQSQEKYNRIVNAHNQSQENYAQMMTAHHQMMNAFKTYMIMKEGTIPQQFAGIFVSPPPAAPSDASSGSISPMVVRGSSSNSNLNENY